MSVPDPAGPTKATSGPYLQGTTKEPTATIVPRGIPGEEFKIIVAPIFAPNSRPSQADVVGRPGRYRVQFLLARPGFPIGKEREFNFIDNVVGTSHVRYTKPKSERGPNDPEGMEIQVQDKNYKIQGITNEDGFLGKFVCELQAENSDAAESDAYGSLAPFLSAWSMNADIPIHIETVQTTNLTNQVSSRRVVAPHLEMNIGGGNAGTFVNEFCQYASIYREGLNSNSAFYRFLCFYKIIESLIAKRGREAADKKKAGLDPRRSYETIPEKLQDTPALLTRLYPWRPHWNEVALNQIFPSEVLGKKITAIRDKQFQPLRVSIAHALLDSGEITAVLDKVEYIHAVNKWLPLCRICARWMLLSDFPKECSLAMK